VAGRSCHSPKLSGIRVRPKLSNENLLGGRYQSYIPHLSLDIPLPPRWRRGSQWSSRRGTTARMRTRASFPPSLPPIPHKPPTYTHPRPHSGFTYTRCKFSWNIFHTKISCIKSPHKHAPKAPQRSQTRAGIRLLLRSVTAPKGGGGTFGSALVISASNSKQLSSPSRSPAARAVGLLFAVQLQQRHLCRGRYLVW